MSKMAGKSWVGVSRRRYISENDRAKLEMIYEVNPYPDTELISQLADNIGTIPSSVRVSTEKLMNNMNIIIYFWMIMNVFTEHNNV